MNWFMIIVHFYKYTWLVITSIWWAAINLCLFPIKHALVPHEIWFPDYQTVWTKVGHIYSVLPTTGCFIWNSAISNCCNTKTVYIWTCVGKADFFKLDFQLIHPENWTRLFQFPDNKSTQFSTQLDVTQVSSSTRSYTQFMVKTRDY